MGLRELAEGIILQSMEDLWNEGYHDESLGFFKGRQFRDYANVAKMGLMEQAKLLDMIKEAIKYQRFRVIRERFLAPENLLHCRIN